MIEWVGLICVAAVLIPIVAATTCYLCVKMSVFGWHQANEIWSRHIQEMEKLNDER